MELVDGLGYVALTVPDLESSIDFYQRIGHLKVTERGKKTAFLSGGSEHHWLRLDEGEAAGLTRIAFELTGRPALDEVVDRLDAIGLAWKAVDDLPGERVLDAIRFHDPDGFEIELFAGGVSLSSPVETFLNMDRFLHAVWLVANPVESAQFYRDVLGFKDSDWIERIAVFMRSANRYHHSAGILLGGPRAGRLDHFCILVDDLDDVMRARNVALSSGVELRQDLVRHAASGSVSTYLVDPVNDISVEFCAWHCTIDDEDYRPRTLQASPATLDLWKASPDGGVIVASYAEQPEAAEDAVLVSDLMA